MSKRDIIALWHHIARLRLANGDKEGAERAKRTAKMISNGVRT